MIARGAQGAGSAAVAVYSADDALSLHLRAADAAVLLAGSGAAACLDGAGIVAAALAQGCDAVHPGYGFISENAGFARACAEAGLVFVGPQPAVLDLFGDKAQARRFAALHGVPVAAGTERATRLDEARADMAGLGEGSAIMVKAVAGGGGRGMRPVTDMADLPGAFERCAAEAGAAFGNGDVYVEQLFVRARQIEVQVLGDGTGAVRHVWERECSVRSAGAHAGHHRRLVAGAGRDGADGPGGDGDGGDEEAASHRCRDVRHLAAVYRGGRRYRVRGSCAGVRRAARRSDRRGAGARGDRPESYNTETL